MDTSYETDVLVWARAQVALLRSGQLALIDIEHIAQEIEAVGKSEQRELARRLSLLLMHLLKWGFQAGRRCASWRRTIDEQRKLIGRQLRARPVSAVCWATPIGTRQSGRMRSSARSTKLHW